MKWLHKLFGWFGVSFGGHNACLKYGCDKYCGYSATELMAFEYKRNSELWRDNNG